MKKIIDGKRYDTNVAEEVASWDNGYYGRDFNQCEETLYRTTKGAWFTVGSGGPLSKYAKHVGNGTSGQSDVFTVLSAGDARELLEEWGETMALEEHFADEIEDG